MLGTNVALSSCGRHLYARQFIKTQAQVQAVQDFCIYEQIQALLRFLLTKTVFRSAAYHQRVLKT